MLRFALAGNPNCGKTTLFNSLTGSTAHVGNWPGVTVEKREGVYRKGEEPIALVDLPGIYSLSPYTEEEVIARSNFSSAILGGEGLFNLVLSGDGIAVLESSVPREELIELVLENDEVRIDGNMAIAWSKSLNFTVEKSSKSLLGSMVSGEGLVNVYKGTGRILMAPVAFGTLMNTSNSSQEPGKTSSGGILGSVINSVLDA